MKHTVTYMDTLHTFEYEENACVAHWFDITCRFCGGDGTLLETDEHGMLFACLECSTAETIWGDEYAKKLEAKL